MNQKKTNAYTRQAKRKPNRPSSGRKTREERVREAAERVVQRHEKALRELAKH